MVRVRVNFVGVRDSILGCGEVADDATVLY